MRRVGPRASRLTVTNDNGSLLGDGLLSDSRTEVVGEEHDPVLGRDFKAQCLLTVLIHVAEQEAYIVPCSIGDLFRVSGASG